MWSYNRWRRRRILARCRVSEQVWQAACARLPLLRGLPPQDLARLRELTALFMHEKSFSGAGALDLSDEMRLTIALQACLPILNLGLDWYRGWVSIIVYPGGFVPVHTYTDEAGVVHTTREPLSGESWLEGPVVLSWPDVEAEAKGGYNLVIHEFAHKLDMRNGAANGMPPLHRGMDPAAWTRDFHQAFEDLQGRVARDQHASPIDPYAVETPAEFFAVLSELFFEAPEVVLACYPAVYRQLQDFYRQDPAARIIED